MMPRFHTGLFSTDLRGANAFFRGAGFVLEKESGRFPGMPGKRLRRERGVVPVVTYDGANEDAWLDGEIMVRAASHDTAKRAFNLLVAAFVVSEGEVAWGIPDPREVANLAQEGNDPANREFATSRDGLTRACELAAKASHQRSSTYAVHKLHLSYRSCSTSLMDFQPSPYKPYRVSKDAMAHVYIANGLTSAYSAIEELRLEVVVPKGQSSRMPDGTWNPKIKAELEHRLRASHIDLSVPHVWI